jgi:NHL repeat.
VIASSAFPVGLAFDGSGNLFVSAGPFAQGQDLILKVAPNGTGSTFATGLYGPRGVAVDSSGNLFVAELGAGDILQFTPNGTGSVFASGFGQLFIGVHNKGKHNGQQIRCFTTELNCCLLVAELSRSRCQFSIAGWQMNRP